MSLATLERLIANEAKEILNNKKFKLKELLEWSSSEEVVRKNFKEDEVVLYLPIHAVWIAVAKSNDKRV